MTDGDNGTLWYQLRGLFLPRRCPTCIKDGKKSWTPQLRPKQSQLTHNGSGIGPVDDPQGVDSLVVAVGSELIAAPYSNDVQVESSADPARLRLKQLFITWSILFRMRFMGSP